MSNAHYRRPAQTDRAAELQHDDEQPIDYWNAPLGRSEAEAMLGRTARLMDYLEKLALDVLTTVGMGDMRKCLAGDFKIPAELKEEGWKDPEPEPEGKTPRQFPLMRLVSMVARWAKIKLDALKVIDPNLFNMIPLTAVNKWLRDNGWEEPEHLRGKS
ncbi:MAG: hypothetical protein R3E76_08270 [Planctomycetota bacterium]